ncbi:MAG: GHKL domain-containing protein [Colwellia sp.]|nr:GHKL domain-containing protein [Colwellia sp.]
MSNKKRIKFEHQLLKYLLVATLVPALLLLYTLWHYQASTNLMALIFLFLFCLIGYCASTLFQKITYQFRTLSNLLEGMAHGDYSLRGRRYGVDDSLGQLVGQINGLAETLIEQRFTAHESQLLVSKVIQHIDVAIIAVDENKHLALLNPAAEKLLNVESAKVLHQPLDHIAQRLLTTTTEQVVELNFAKGKRKFQVIRDQYREHGQQHELFFVTDVNVLLRDHERQAWQNLIRVLSHEINNSLAPIASLANTLQTLASKQELNSNFSQHLAEGLEIITERAQSLKIFINSYRQLTHLPEPKKVAIHLQTLFDKIIPLFNKRKIAVDCQHQQLIFVDPVQFEQVLINLLKNADEAMADGSKSILIKVNREADSITVNIIDSGVGIKNTDNLFTPFYTTKKQGSGIGLVLCRQIIEAHQGDLSLENRSDQQGCIVKIELPIAIKNIKEGQ